ncbi:MAG TPA: dienelactone hydrolase family protein [Methylomirabilota bacterium]|nr:dienelactone hydrolase family protein [Methylomirabilota bacterium]
MVPRVIAVPLLTALTLAACAPTIKDTRDRLSAQDRGRIAFATPDTLARAADSRLVPADPIALTGELTLPAGAGPFPAVVLMHGCGGLGNAEGGWVTPLTGAGYATFVVDSFTGRGLAEVCRNARALISLQRVPDAYGALRILATHPRLDAGRIALMGFSHGGGLTLGASTRWAHDRYTRTAAAAFRAFLPFYPGCNNAYPERLSISAPLRIHIGELDDWTPAAPCQELVDTLRRSGQDAEITVYPGAHHSFDNVGRRVTWLPAVDSAAGCTIEAVSILGPVKNAAEVLGCLRKGATLGWSAAATEQARRKVLAQLSALLR